MITRQRKAQELPAGVLRPRANICPPDILRPCNVEEWRCTTGSDHGRPRSWCMALLPLLCMLPTDARGELSRAEPPGDTLSAVARAAASACRAGAEAVYAPLDEQTRAPHLHGGMDSGGWEGHQVLCQMPTENPPSPSLCDRNNWLGRPYGAERCEAAGSLVAPWFARKN